jgi:hypothetical protein
MLDDSALSYENFEMPCCCFVVHHAQVIDRQRRPRIRDCMSTGLSPTAVLWQGDVRDHSAAPVGLNRSGIGVTPKNPSVSATNLARACTASA